MADDAIRAAGVVVIRGTPRNPRILMVHRPTHRDWSLPKGKLDKGEHVVAAAVRECIEETGVTPILGPWLGQHSYKVMGRTKLVDYWIARAGKVRDFRPNDEIDKILWANPRRARTLLTYKRDVELVGQALEHPVTWPLILLRHADAERRGSFKGKDSRRPLNSGGTAAAKALIPLLAAYGTATVVSSSSRRCVDTLRPYAKSARLKVREEPVFSEESFEDRPKAAVGRVEALAHHRHAVVVCTHRPLLPALIGAFTDELSRRDELLVTQPLPPGGLVVIHREMRKRRWRVAGVERHELG